MLRNLRLFLMIPNSWVLKPDIVSSPCEAVVLLLQGSKVRNWKWVKPGAGLFQAMKGETWQGGQVLILAVHFPGFLPCIWGVGSSSSRSL